MKKKTLAYNRLADRLRRYGPSRGGAIPRQFLRLPLVRRSRIVNAAQDAAVHQMS